MDQTIVLVNIIGALLQFLYIIMYFQYTKQKVSMHLQRAQHSGYMQLILDVRAAQHLPVCFLSEAGDVSDYCSSDGADLLLVLLHHVSS